MANISVKDASGSTVSVPTLADVTTAAQSLDTKTPALGQALAAASTPVVLTAAQIATLTPPAAIAGFSTAAKQPTLGTGTMAGSSPVTLATDDTQIGEKTTASVLGAGGSGLIGWLSDAVTQLKALFGVKTSANSVSVAPASDAVFSGYSYLSSPSQQPYGIVAKIDPFGGLQTAGASTPLLSDPFDTALDTTNRWSVSGTSPPVVSGGSVVASLGASNSVSSVMISQPTFIPGTQPILLAGQLAIGAAQTNPNAHRFFGVGVVSSYASATPLTDGHGFEVDLTGALNAVVYISGVRYVVNSTNPALITASGSWATGMTMSNYGANLTWPANGIAIISMRYFNGFCYFYMAQNATGFDVPIGIATWIPATNTFPLRLAAITTPAVSTVLATTFSLSGFILGVSGGSNFTNSDPTYPWRQQGVDAAGRAAVITPELTATGNITTQNLVPAGVATANSSVSLATNGMPNLMIQVTGTYTGALSLQATVDNATWVTLGGVPLINLNTGGYLASITSALQGIFQADVAGAIAVRVTGLAAMTGTAVVTIRATPIASMIALDAALPTGTNSIGSIGTVTTVTTLSGTTALTPGVAATNLGKAEDAVAVSGDTGVFVLGVRRDVLASQASAAGDYIENAITKYGGHYSYDQEKQLPTYSATATITPAASATDIAILPGNATNTVYMTKVSISGIQTTGGMVIVNLVKRSTANSGGTSAGITAVPMDSADSAAVSAPLSYSANPTPGTSVGNVDATYVPIVGATGVAAPVVFNFGERAKSVKLSGVAQGLAVNLGGVTVTGGSVIVRFEWREEP